MTRFRSATALRRSSLRRSLGLSTALGVTLGIVAAPALAQETTTPTTPTVQSGVVIFANGVAPLIPIPSGAVDGTLTTLNVNVLSPKAIVNWQTFDIAAAGTVNFQAVAPAVILNRVTSADVSQIAGQMNAPANLQVWLVNTNGIMFGNGAAINVGGLVASTLDLTNDNDFSTGNSVRLQGLATAAGAIGTIAGVPASINTGSGVLALIAPQIDLTATINQATGSGTGPTAFAIATDVSLTTSPGGPLSITLNAGTRIANHNIAGTVVGDRVYALLSAQDGFNALLGVAAPVTNASVNAQGVVVLSGAGFSETVGGDTLSTGTAGSTPALASASLSSVNFLTPFGGPTAVAPTTGVVTARAAGGTLGTSAIAAAGNVSLGNNGAGAVTVGGAVSARDYTVTGAGVTLNGATTARTVALNAGAGTLTVGGTMNVSGNYAITGGTFAGTDVLAPVFTGTGNDFSITDTAGGLSLGTLNAPGTLTVTTTGGGTLTVGGVLGSTGEGVILNSAAGIILNAGLSASGASGLLSLTGPVTLGADVTLATSGAATLAGTVDATTAGAQSLTVNAGGLTSVNGRVGATAALNALTTDATGGTRINTDIVTTTGAQSYGDAVVLGTGTTLTGAGATFTAGLNGNSGGNDHDLALNFSTAQTITGATITGVRNLSVGAPAGGTTLLGTIATSGTQAYADPITLGNAVTLTSSGAGAAGNIGFTGTVNGAAGSLTTTTAGMVTFGGGGVGGTAAPLFVDTSGAAATAINADVTTSGAQTYGAATIGAGAITTASTGGGAIRFQSTLGGPGGLTVTTSGLTRFAGVVSGLAGLTTDAGGTTEINADVTTTAAQAYNDAVTLTGGATTTLDAGANAVTFANTLRSANQTQGLVVAAASSLVFNGDVGTATGGRLESLIANGTTTLGGSGLRTVRTVNDQTYTGLLSLAMTPATGSGAVLNGRQGFFPGAIAGGGNDLALDFTGTTTISGATFSAVRNLATGNGGTTVLDGTAGAIVTAGAQTYNDAVTLVGNVSVTGGTGSDIGFNGTVDGTVAGASNLIVNASGRTTFGGIVGGTTTLASVTTDAAGTTAITTTAIMTTGVQNYGDAVVLGATPIPATTVLTSTGAGNITFASTVDAATTEDQGLTVNTGGTTTFGDRVGFTTRLASLTTDAGGTTRISGGIVTTENDQNYGDSLILVGNTRLTGRSFLTTGVVDAGGNSLTLRFDTPGAISDTRFANLSDIDVDGRVSPTSSGPGDVLSGGGACLTGDTCGGGGGGPIQIAGTLTTGGSQTYGRAVVVTANATRIAGGGVTFRSTVDALTDGGQGLAVNTANAGSFLGAVGGATRLASLTTDAGGTTDLAGGVVRTTGLQTYNDQVRLFANTRLEGLRADLGAAGQITGQGFGLTLNMTGDQIVDGAKITGVGAFDTDRSPFAVAGRTLLTGNFATSGSQTFRDPVVLTAATIARSTGAGDIAFENTVNGAYALDVRTGGVTTFGGLVGATTALTALTTDTGGSTVIKANVTTTATQTYNDAVTLSAPTVQLTVPTTITLTAGATTDAITFAGTLASVNEQQALVANSPVLFQGDVGGVAGGAARLLSLTANAATAIGLPATVTPNTLTIRTVGAQTYNAALALRATAATPFEAVLAGTTGTFNGAIGGNGNDLTLNFSGATTIDGATFTGIRNLRRGGGGATSLSGIVETAGGQTYGDNVTLTAATVLRSGPTGTGSGAISLLGAVDGAYALTIRTAGTTTFGTVATPPGSAVGATAPLLSLDVAGTGPIALNGGAITTVGTQHYAGATTIGRDLTLTTTAANITFDQGVAGAAMLSAKTGAASPPATGTVAFGGPVTLGSLAVRANTLTTVAAGNQIGTFAATVGTPLTFVNAGALTIGTVDGLNGATSPGAVSIAAGGLVTLAQGVTGTGVSLTGTGITQLTGADVAAGTGQLLLDGNDGDMALGAALTTTNTGALAIRLVDARDVQLGAITTGAGGTVALGIAGADNLSRDVTQRAGTVITAGTLIGSIAGAATLTNANAVGTLGQIGANGFAYRSANALTVTGPVDGGTGNVGLQTNAGALTLGGDVRAIPGGTVTLVSAATINQTAGAITAGALAGSSVGGATLMRSGNDIATLAGFTNTGAGGFDFTDSTGLTITNTVDAGSGLLRINAATINFPGQTVRSTGNVTLTAAGQIVGSTVNGAAMTITGGPVADIGSAIGGSLSMSAGTVRLGTGSVGGSATLTAGGDVTVTGSLTAGPLARATGGGIATIAAITATGNNASVEVRGSSVSLGLAEATAASSTMDVRSTSGDIAFTRLQGAGTKTVTAGTGIGGGTIAGAGGATLTAAATSPITVTSIGAPGAGVAALTVNGGSLVTIGAANSTSTNLVVAGDTAIGQGTPVTGALTVNGAVTSGGRFTSTTTTATDLDAVDSVGALAVTTGPGGALSFTDLTGAGAKTLVSGGSLSGASINGAGAVALTAASTGLLTIAGPIGDAAAVNGLTVNGGSIASFGTANSTATAINSTGAVSIGTTTQPGALTVNGTIFAPSFTSRTSGTTDLDDVTGTGAIGVTTTGTGDVLFGTLNGAGAKTVTSGGGITGGSVLGTGAVALTAAAQPVTISGVIGTAATRAASLTVNGGAPVTLGSGAAGQTIYTVGDVSIGQATTVGALAINGGVNAGGLFAATAAGLVDLDGVSAGTTLSATSTNGAVVFDRLVAPGTTTVGAATSLNGNAVDGGGALRLVAGINSPLAVGSIGATTAAASLTVSGGATATFGAANATGTTINVAGAMRIGQAGDGAATGVLTVNGNVVNGGTFTTTTTGGSTFADVTSAGALSVTTGTGNATFANLLGAGPKAVNSGLGILGTAIQGAGTVTLTAATASPITIGSIGTVSAPVSALAINGGSLVTLGAANSGATNVAVTGVTAIGQTIATAALTINGAVTTGSLLSTTTGATLLGATTASTGDIGVTAGGAATIGGAVSTVGAYRVRGSAVTLGANVTQAARGLVDITATGGAVTAGTGLTLQSNSDGTGAEYLAVQASGGLLFGGTTLLGGTAAQRSDIGLIAQVGPVILGAVTGRALGGFDTARTTIGTLTTAGDITASGAITVQRALALTSTGGLINIGNATVTDAGAGITLTTAPNMASGGGAVGFDRLSAPGATTINAATSITGNAIDGGGALRLVAGTASPITIGAIGTTTAPASLTISGGNALTLGTATATGTTVNVAGAIRIGQPVDGAATGALTVNGNVVSGGAVAATTAGATVLRQTTATGAIAVTASTITAGQTNAGAALSMTSGGALSVTGAQAGGDATFDAGATVTLGQVTAGTSSAIAVKALDAAISGTQRAARVTFTNRAPTTQGLKLGTGPTGTGFTLDQGEVNLVQAGQVAFDGGIGNVEIGALAFGGATGSTRVEVLATGRIDVTGAVTGTGTGRAFRFGGSAATVGDKASVIRVVATVDGGGRLLFDTADLELRGSRIGVGQAAGFLDPIGFGASSGLSAAQVASAFVGNPNSALYNATYGGLVYTSPGLVAAKTLTVRYGDYALFQNTGAPGFNAGVTLSGLATPSNPALTVQGPGNTANDFALFGTINGITGSATAVLGSTTLVFSATDLANTRINGCLVGSGSGCLSSVVSQPLLNVFDRSRADVFRSAEDLALPFDPLVGTNNEALFSGLGLLDAGVTATECAADTTSPGCEQKKEQGK